MCDSLIEGGLYFVRASGELTLWDGARFIRNVGDIKDCSAPIELVSLYMLPMDAVSG